MPGADSDQRVTIPQHVRLLCGKQRGGAEAGVRVDTGGQQHFHP